MTGTTDGGARVFSEPVARGVGAGEEVDLVAERRADGGRCVGGDDRDDRGGRVDEGVQRAPGVELLAAGLEAVRGRTQVRPLPTIRPTSSYSVSGLVARASRTWSAVRPVAAASCSSVTGAGPGRGSGAGAATARGRHSQGTPQPGDAGWALACPRSGGFSGQTSVGRARRDWATTSPRSRTAGSSGHRLVI